ncbi:hypothetical protein [Lentilactobacillus farraginis]|nr:hypothetical protein [Lentilactobacillus farraginis]GAF37316.1 hypothetical protein JCM14108_2339 [Lentilactobacillus farraginis DSM 18382 = JCM 14108]
MAQQYFANSDPRVRPDLTVGLPGTIDSSTVTADSSGKKVVLQGTPVGATTDWLSADQSKGTTKLSEFTGADGQEFAGVIAADTDVTAGDADVTVWFENVYLRQKLLDSTVVAALQAVAGKTPGVKLINR